MNLYEINRTIRSILEIEPENEDELSAMMQALDEWQGEFADKVDNIVRYIRNLTREAEAVRAEEEELYKKRKALENKADRLKAYIAANMAGLGLRELKAGLFKLRFQSAPPAISIVDENAIPEKFKKVQVSYDKLAIKEALKNGEAIPGIEIQRGEMLVIK